MKGFKFFFFFIIISFFVFDHLNCGKFEHKRERSGTNWSSSSEDFSDSSDCSCFSSSSVGKGRIALMFVEGWLESEYRKKIYDQIIRVCFDKEFQNNFIKFYCQESFMIHEFFKLASRINLSEFQYYYDDDLNLQEFNKLAKELNLKFKHFMNEKANIYQKLFELIKNGFNGYYFYEKSKKELLNAYGLLIKHNEKMKKEFDKKLSFIEPYVDLISEEDYLSK